MSAAQHLTIAADRTSAGEIMESVIVKGDLGKLTPDERSRYYVEVCKSIGLNPLTKPFEYITLNGKLTLYALRACTDQLRAIYKVSVVELTEAERDGVVIVTAKMQNAEGRTDMAKGAVTIGGLKGDALANAIMKAETKAKRRATLSLCGLGFLDETETETIPAAVTGPPKRTRAEIQAGAQHKRSEMLDRIPTDLAQIETLSELERYKAEVLTPEFMTRLGVGQYGVEEMVGRREEELKEAPEPEGEIVEEVVEASPLSKADYVRHCHEIIDQGKEEKALLAWWNAKESKEARRAVDLTKEEVQALVTRVMQRREELTKATA